MNTILYVLGALLAAAGMVGAMVPVVPAIPLIFVGIWLIAGADGYAHVGVAWLSVIAVVGAIGVAADLLAAALGAQRAGASRRAVWGALVGTVVGLFFGLPGVVLGPFVGAVVGELSAGFGVLRSTHVGASTWLGLLIGTLVKFVACTTMLTMFGMAWWWARAH